MRQRYKMVDDDIARYGAWQKDLLRSMRMAPRHEFVPPEWRDRAYEDRELPDGNGGTIPRPYMTALLLELAQVKTGTRVLEVGAGAGYHTAVMAGIAAQVYSIVRDEVAAKAGQVRLHALGYSNVTIRSGDGMQGWPEHAPFNAIIMTFEPEHVPDPLLRQLAPGGRLLFPVGDRGNGPELAILEKDRTGRIGQAKLIPLRFTASPDAQRTRARAR